MFKKILIMSLVLSCAVFFTGCKKFGDSGEVIKAITMQDAVKEAEKAINADNASSMADKLLNEVTDESK